MMTLRCLLIDDEPLALDRLERLLAAYPEIQILGKISRPSEAVRQIDELRPDVIFLDIQMPGLTGFQVLEKIHHQPVVIFVTAYDRYALDAFEVNSIDYLLKPIQRERLDKSIQKLSQLLSARAAAKTGVAVESGELNRLLDYIREQGGKGKRKLVSRQGDRMLLIEPADVAYFHARDKYTFAVTSKGEHILDYTLQQLKEWLPEEKFLMIHRSYIVNLDWISELSRGFGGGLMCRLRPPVSRDLPVSRAMVQQVRERIGF